MRYQDIELTKDEISDTTKYTSFGANWIIISLRNKQARKYISLYTETFDERSRQAGRCYVVGQSSYRRKDGKPITQDDLDAVSFLDHGQINIVDGGVGSDSLTHRWECDSGD